MRRSLYLVADDYGLSPGVNDAILMLLRMGRLTGTGSMTLFPDWDEDGRRLAGEACAHALGLHLTLTDQPACATAPSLAPNGKLPPYKMLVAGLGLGRIAEADIHAELDRQADRFAAAVGRQPDYLDGHQHVHFLPAVRRWIKGRFGGQAKPVLRGAPTAAANPAARVKTAIVRATARGFDREMRKAGFAVAGPLAGLYDWRDASGFPAMVERGLAELGDGTLMMCHPGRVDDVLRSRDPLLSAREAELAYLGSERFGAALTAAAVSIGTFTA